MCIEEEEEGTLGTPRGMLSLLLERDGVITNRVANEFNNRLINREENKWKIDRLTNTSMIDR